jgi:uncharacterized protein
MIPRGYILARLLFIFLVGFIAYFLIKSYFKKLNQQQRPPDVNAENKAEDKKMLRCEHCGIHAPQSEGVTAEGKFYCSDEHYRLSAKK